MILTRLVFLLVLLATHVKSGKYDAFNVKGEVYCHNEPHEDAVVVFYEFDDWFSDLCYVSHTDEHGAYTASGYEDDSDEGADALDYYIVHRCNRIGRQFCVHFTAPTDVWARNHKSTDKVLDLGRVEVSNSSLVQCPCRIWKDIKRSFGGNMCEESKKSFYENCRY
ncbi:hypothetical protein M3Y98_00734400 [Aphelenchoides besseyi]|nr:hypothetical protein M3Y98_00734400 [Aphelenchoides besseyi]KAI6211401.1 hypothetical protein M3Y96_00430300 [Aphelenchoides besseyi]